MHVLGSGPQHLLQALKQQQKAPAAGNRRSPPKAAGAAGVRSPLAGRWLLQSGGKLGGKKRAREAESQVGVGGQVEELWTFGKQLHARKLDSRAAWPPNTGVVPTARCLCLLATVYCLQALEEPAAAPAAAASKEAAAAAHKQAAAAVGGAMLDADDDTGGFVGDAGEGAGAAEEEAVLQLAQEYPTVGNALCSALLCSGYAALLLLCQASQLFFSLCTSPGQPDCSQKHLSPQRVCCR